SPARSWAGIGCVFGDLVDDSGRHARGEVDSFEIEAVGDLVTRATRCGVKDRQPGRAGHNTPARPRDESRACGARAHRSSSSAALRRARAHLRITVRLRTGWPRAIVRKWTGW